MASGESIVIDSPIVDRAAIERSIRRFQQLGETDWQNHDPSPRDHLPFQTEAEAMVSIAPREQQA